MKSLAVSDENKRIDLEEFFNTINVRNDPLIQIKKKLIFLTDIAVVNLHLFFRIMKTLLFAQKRCLLVAKTNRQ